MALLMDLAVLAFALVVVASIALLAWTIGPGADDAVAAGRRRVAGWRDAVQRSEQRIAVSSDGRAE